MPDLQNDPAYVYRVAFVPKTANRLSAADVAVEFVKAGSDEAKEINRILLKEVDKKRFTAKQICKMMQDEGFPKFNQEQHTRLWKELGGEGSHQGVWQSRRLQEHLGLVRQLGRPRSSALPRTSRPIRVVR